MNEPVRRILFWSPRILTIAFALFISVFALDVFDEASGFAQTALALLMHLIPTFLVLLSLAVAWRREWLGGVLFTALGIAYIVMAWGRFPLGVYFAIAGPLFVLGALFFFNWIRRSELRSA